METGKRRREEDMRTVVLCFALIAGRAFAQDAPAQNAPEKAVRDIRDVEPGMSRDHVLSGLSDQYDCTKMDTHEEGYEWWYVQPKYDPKSSVERESGRIWFSQGKVDNVSIDLYPSMTGEAPRFAGRLFRLLYDRADPPASPNKVQKLVNVRYATLPVELHNEQLDELEQLTLIFTVGGQRFSIIVWKQQGKPDFVDIVQDISGVATSQK
jgi:hypothetical protein